MSGWLKILENQCADDGRKAVAARIGYSTAVISLVLSHNYKGDLKAVERAVIGKLTVDVVDCPVLGEIAPSVCSSHQSRGFSSASSMRVKLFKACRSCPNNSRRKESS